MIRACQMKMAFVLLVVALVPWSVKAALQVGDCYDMVSQLPITADTSPVLCTATTMREASTLQSLHCTPRLKK